MSKATIASITYYIKVRLIMLIRLLMPFFTLLFFILPITSFGNQISTHKYQLTNGLTLIVRPDHRAPIATVQVWYKIGSVYEISGSTGLSHFLEHMMFKGTPKNPGTTFADTIYQVGGDLNAFADVDFTAYHETLPAQYVETALRLEADRMQHLIVDSAEIFEKEKQVILEERRMRVDDQPISLTYERFLATAFTSSPYRSLPIGWHEDVAATTLDDIVNWYNTWYAPNNATLIVIGDVQPDEIYQLAKKYFDDIPRKTLPVIKPQPEVQPLGEKRITVRTPAALQFLLMGFHTPVLNKTPVLWEPAALTLLSAILDGGESARLSKSLIRGSRVAAHASTSYDPFMRNAHLFTFSAIPADNVTVPQLEAALLEQITLLQTELITPEELERARKRLIASQIYKMDSIDAQAYEIGSLESVGLHWEVGNEFLQEVLLITPEQVQAVAIKYLNPEYMIVATLEPQAIHPELTPEVEVPLDVVPSDDVAPIITPDMKIITPEENITPVVDTIDGDTTHD
jgi:zinc protease